MIYYFCGHRGCGKNYLANELCTKFHIKTIDTGPIIREYYSTYKSNETFSGWIQVNESKYGNNFANKIICKKAALNPNGDTIIIGFRSMDGINFFNNYFKIRDYKITFIDGDFELFRENYNNREGKNISKEEYEKIVKIEDTMGIEQIKNFVLNDKVHGQYFYKSENNTKIYDDFVRKFRDREEMDR